eukprot:8994629-Pyramimonas_sp.AAC.1
MRVKLQNSVCGTHVGGPIRGFGGAPYWRHATLYWVGENVKLRLRGACGRFHWGRQWSSPLGHETLYWAGGNAKFGFRDAGGRFHQPRNVVLGVADA